MYFLFSGEGPSDLGFGLSANLSEGNNYKPGPLTLLVSQIVDDLDGYSIMEFQCFGYVSKKHLKEYFDEKKPLKVFPIPRREMRESQGTKYFENNARALAEIAKEIAQQKDDDVVAILFRDSDRRNSSGKVEWERKRKSMLSGFKTQRFDRGVAMMPNPCSEAWILCALYRKGDPNQNCDKLESSKYGAGEQHSLKTKLEDYLNQQACPNVLNPMIENQEIHYRFISLNSFQVFLDNLQEAIK